MTENDFKVVIVDDDKDVLEVTKMGLEALGFGCVPFFEVQSAVEYIATNKHKVSMILSDLRMDNINGFEFKKLVNDHAKDIPFVIITGYWTKEMSAEAMSLGIDAFIEKPVTEDILKDQVEKYAQVRMEQLIDEREMVLGFLEESEPMLDEIESLILELEEDPSNEQTLSVYFRLLHTIKGTASCVGLTKLGEYTHTYEDFINELRNKVIPVNTVTTNVLLEGLDDLKFYFSHIQKLGSDSDLNPQERIAKYDVNQIAANKEESTEVQVKKEDKTDNKQARKDDDKMTVAMSLLNNFMEESGELTVIRNSILKTVKKIENKYRGDNDIEILNELLDGMYNVTSNIQGKITEMRKVPLQNTFRPFKRLIRDLSKQLGKDVDLEIEGEELSVDNIVAKLFNNTLIHILRNSLDHGLETPEQREKIGKNPTGSLKIKVEEVGEEIVLKIFDDGKGINPDIIKNKALEKGLYSEGDLEKMTQLEIVNIIFDSGFSTAEQVSDLSGRGVGMDMVRGSFEGMGGSVYVQSRAGEGSTFTLSVPIPKSVLIVNTLSVGVEGETFIFHMDEVAEVVRFVEDTPNSRMYEMDGQKILDHNQSTIQLMELSQILGIDKTQSKESNSTNVVVLRVGTTKFGIIVNEIYDFEEVVSRKISEKIESNDLYHGASLLGSGEVALILSAEGIAERVGVTLEKSNSKTNLNIASEEENTSQEENEFMLFKYNAEDFLAIPLNDVERLEKVEKDKVETIGSNYIVRYLDKVLPIIEPASFLGLYHGSLDEKLKDENKELLELIIVNVGDKKFGVLVHELDEIQKCHEEMNKDTIKTDGLLGSVYIKDRTICVLDLTYLFDTYHHNKLGINKREIPRLAA